MALLTNNVREWEPLWRSMLPVDEIFELVVDSAFVGHAKARPADLRAHGRAARRRHRAGRLPLRRRRGVNFDAARELGMRAVHFRDNEQAIGEIEAALGP